MGSSLGSTMVNIKMTKLEIKVVKPVLSDGTVKLYYQYADDTLFAAKPQDVTQKLLNSFDKRSNFTVDLFEN